MADLRHAGLVTALVAAALGAGQARAQIRVDGSMGGASVALMGPHFVIPQALGALRGANLFHSFSTFNVGTGQSATFTTTTSGIANVIARVTGGDPSLINGTLRLSAVDGRPALFLVNPAGVTFGAGASLDVPGAFHVASADYVKFPDGNFYADPASASTLSSASPEAFGFLDRHHGAVQVTAGATLATRLLQPFSIASGDITVADGSMVASDSGDVRIVALGDGPGEVALTGPLPAAHGQLRITNGASISASTSSGADGGSLLVHAGDITIDGQGNSSATGLLNDANTGSTGNAGPVTADAGGSITLLDGGQISSTTYAGGNAQSVRVTAQSLLIDGKGNTSTFTGIVSNADVGSTGHGGTIDVSCKGDITLRQYGEIIALTVASGDAGAITVAGDNILIDAMGTGPNLTGIASSSQAGSGNAGTVDVSAKNRISLLNGAEILSDTWTSGHAGNVTVKAADMVIDGGPTGGNIYTGIASSADGGTGDGGTVRVLAAHSLTLTNQGAISAEASEGTGNGGNILIDVPGVFSIDHGGYVSSSTYTSGNAGDIRIDAGTLTLDGQGTDQPLTGILTEARSGSSGKAGVIDLNIGGSLSVNNGAIVASDTYASGNAGQVNVTATDVAIGGFGGLYSQAQAGSTGDAGSINVTASNSLAMAGGFIATTTYGSGNAGPISVEAGKATIDGGFFPSGIQSLAQDGSTGNAGPISLRVAGDLVVKQDGQISSDTFSVGNAGTVDVTAQNITMGDLVGGDFSVQGRGTGIFSQSVSRTAVQDSNHGNAGSITVGASGKLTLLAGGEISSSTQTSGNGGSVHVSANDILIDGLDSLIPSGIYTNSSIYQGDPVLGGKAGDINVTVANSLTINPGGRITSSTSSDSPAGTVDVSAPVISIKNDEIWFFSGIDSLSLYGAGNAGTVRVTASQSLQLLSGGEISSSSSRSSTGSAGSVYVDAGLLVVDGSTSLASSHYFESESRIAANANGLSGQTGSVNITADRIVVSNGGVLAITNDVTVQDPHSVTPTLLSVSAPVIDIGAGGAITAASTGNVAASNVHVDVGSQLFIHDGGAITTSAVNGNGGAISITGNGFLQLHDGQITTSVSGEHGNGGDISIATRGIVMDTGFIQANTAAQSASGGDVNIDVDFLIPSGNLLFVGGTEPLAFRRGVYGLNVIQAAAPTGVSGTIDIGTPVLDVSAGLVGLNAAVLDLGGLARSVCDVTGGSSLAMAGRGGMPPRATDLLRAEPAGPAAPFALTSVATAGTAFGCGR